MIKQKLFLTTNKQKKTAKKKNPQKLFINKVSTISA